MSEPKDRDMDHTHNAWLHMVTLGSRYTVCFSVCGKNA